MCKHFEGGLVDLRIISSSLVHLIILVSGRFFIFGPFDHTGFRSISVGTNPLSLLVTDPKAGEVLKRAASVTLLFWPSSSVRPEDLMVLVRLLTASINWLINSSNASLSLSVRLSIIVSRTGRSTMATFKAIEIRSDTLGNCASTCRLDETVVTSGVRVNPALECIVRCIS